MTALLLFAVNSLIFAATLYFGIRLLDSGNSTNTPGLAAVLGAVFSLPYLIGFGAFGLIPLIALLMLLTTYYDVGFIRSFLVVLFMGIAGAVIRGALAGILAPVVG